MIAMDDHDRPASDWQYARRMKKHVVAMMSIFLAISTLVACTAAEGDGGSEQSDDISSFVSWMRLVQHDYEPAATPSDLAQRSDLVIVGTIVGVKTGQSYAPLPGAEEEGDVSSVIEVQVDEKLSGDVDLTKGGSAYIQITNPAYVGDGSGQGKLVPFDLAAFQETVPIGTSGVFFLIDITDQPVYEYVIDKGAGRPGGSSLLGTHVQGFVLEASDGSLVSAHEPLDAMAPAWQKLDSIDDVRLAVSEVADAT
jgi:hypothetical protein